MLQKEVLINLCHFNGSLEKFGVEVCSLCNSFYFNSFLESKVKKQVLLWDVVVEWLWQLLHDPWPQGTGDQIPMEDNTLFVYLCQQFLQYFSL